MGAPPHGGIAFGLDRLAMLVAGVDSLREVIAFPKGQGGIDPLTGAPTASTPAALAELGLRLARPARESLSQQNGAARVSTNGVAARVPADTVRVPRSRDSSGGST